MTPDRTTWIDAAVSALLTAGGTAVRPAAIAARLNVEPEAFYQEFSDHGDLVQAVLSRWEDEVTDAAIDRASAAAGGPVERLRELTVPSDPSVRLPPPLEGAVRAWAAKEPLVADRLREADSQRIDFVSGLLVEAGVNRDRARIRAEIWYQSMTGMYATSQSPARPRREIVDELLAILTA